MKQLLLLVLLVGFGLTNCQMKKENSEPEPEAKYRITVDDGRDMGIMSLTNYNAVSYTYDKGGITFVTTDGKEHFTTYKVTITQR